MSSTARKDLLGNRIGWSSPSELEGSRSRVASGWPITTRYHHSDAPLHCTALNIVCHAVAADHADDPSNSTSLHPQTSYSSYPPAGQATASSPTSRARAWGKSKESDPTDVDVPHERKEERPPSLSQPTPKRELNKDLKRILEREESWFDNIYDGGCVFLSPMSLMAR